MNDLYGEITQLVEEELQQESFIDTVFRRKTHKIGKEAISQLQDYASDPIGNINTINSIYDELTQIEKENSPAANSLYDALDLARELISKQYSNRSSDTASTKSYDGYDIDSPEAVKARGDKRRRLARYKQDQEDERRKRKQRAKDNVRRGFDAGLVDYADLEEMVKEELETFMSEEFGDDAPFRARDMIPPKLRGKFKDTFTKVPGAEGSLSGGKISKMPKAKAAWKAAGGQLSVFDKEAIAKFHEDADLNISLEKYMDNIKYAIKGDRLGRRIYSLRDALALANPTGTRRGHLKKNLTRNPQRQAPEFTRESQMSLEEIVEQELNFALDEKRKKKKKKKKKKKGKKDACYHKVKARYDVWPSAYASGALVKCRKVGAANWGNSKKEHVQAMVENELTKVLQEKKINEVEDMSSKGNAGKDFPIPSAAWDRALYKNNIMISYEGRMGVEKVPFNKQAARNNGITFYPLFPSKGGFMGAYGKPYSALADSGGAFALHLVDAAIEEAKMMCEKGEYTKTGRYETSGVSPRACKMMGWRTPVAAMSESIEDLVYYTLFEVLNEKKNLDEDLRKWFGRKGAPGKKKGWVDCNTCRKDKKTGRKKCSACGRSSGEKRSKYPSCRPTPSACGKRGKWGKKSKKGKKG